MAQTLLVARIEAAGQQGVGALGQAGDSGIGDIDYAGHAARTG
jgi:hypothetical protein